MERTYGARYGSRNYNRIDRALGNEMQRRLNKTSAGRLMIDVSKSSDGGLKPEFSPGNTAQRLYNMSRLGNNTAKRLLYTKYDTVDRGSNALRDNVTKYVTASKSQGTT